MAKMYMKYREPNEIYPIPVLHPRIKKAVSDEKLVIFIGAGVSRIIGCLGWKDLSVRLIDIAYKEELINFHEKERLVKEPPRKIITIFQQILGREKYEKVLKDSLQAKNSLVEKYPIYEKLYKMRAIYITTNIDVYFDKYFESSNIFNYPYEFRRENIKVLSLFHLHGSITVSYTHLTLPTKA